MNDLFNLFISFLKIGSFSFGGAYSLLPLIEDEVVKNHNWLTQEEFLKVLGMVEVIPGAISIKFATFTGYKVAGVPGAVIANLGNIITPAVLIILVTIFYSRFESNIYISKAFEGIKFAVIGVIVAMMIKYTQTQFTSWKNLIFLILGIVLAYFFKINPILIIIGAGIISLLIL